MLFWIVATLLTMMACLSVLLPFLQRRTPMAEATQSPDLAIYKDQLAEVERDQARGLIGRAEAEQARTEIGRRILRANEDVGLTRAQSSRWGRMVTAAAVLSVPLVSWSVYAATGSPDQPAQPLQARLQESPAEMSVEQLIARAEAHLQAQPTDGRGWEVLAPIYLRVGRTDDAVRAYQQAIATQGSSAIRQTGLGEALVAQAGGTVRPEAQSAFQEAVELSPADPKARFFLALASAQRGQLEQAKAAWEALKADQPDGSPWKNAVDQALARTAAGQNSVARANPADASSSVDPQRDEMIEGMVASLDARLRDNPRDPEGWQRLVRSYVVLGRQDDARDALRRGLAALGNTTRDAAALQTFAQTLSVAGSTQP